MKKRNYKFDNIKFILIFLVVLGHSLYSYKGPNSKIATDIVYFIYSFHMPIFCFVSGMFSKKELKKEQIFKLFGLFVIMNTSFYIYDFIDSGNVTLPLFKYSSWYLIYLLLYRWLYSKITKKKLWFLLSLGIGLLISFIPYKDDLIFLYRGIYYFAFFMLGGIWEFKSINKIIKELEEKKVWISIISIILIILTIYVIHNNNFTLNYFTIAYYKNGMEFFYRILFLINSLFLIMCLLLYVPDKKWLCFSRMGEMSLSIYFFHRIFTLIFSDYFVENDYFVIIAVIFSILLCFIFSSKICEMIINGIVKVISNKIAFVILSVLLMLLFSLVGLDINLMNVHKDYLFSVVKKEEVEDIKKNSISIGFVGDLILLEDQVKNSYKNGAYDFDYMFQYMKKYFLDTDYMIGVFEGVSNDNEDYSVSNFGDGKDLRVNYPSSFIKSIKKNGFDLVTTSNNHILDRGLNSVYTTIDNMNKYDLDYVGTYKNNEEKLPKIVRIAGMKVGIVSYTYGVNNYTEDELFKRFEGITNYLCSKDSKNLDKVKEQIDSDFDYLKKKMVDFIIVLPHMGTQFSHKTDEYQEYWNSYFIDKGANLILGDHSHAVQPIQYIQNSLIVNSPGNYNNSYTKNDGDLSLMVKVYIDKKTKNIRTASIIPIYAYKDFKHGYCSLPIYDVFNGKIDNLNVSQLDIERMINGVKIITHAAMGLTLRYDEIQDELFYFRDGYKRQEVKELELSDEEYDSAVYQKMLNSNKICFIGDSITEGTKNSGYPWYEAITSGMDNEVINISKGGYTSQDVIDNLADEIEDSKCDLNVIAIGTNDIRYNDLDINIFLENMDRIISYTNGNIIIVSPWKTLENDRMFSGPKEYYERLGKYDEYSKKLQEFSENKGYIFVDPNDYIENVLRYNVATNYYVDPVHPNSSLGIELYSRSVLH